ncbi:hypothetical protein J4H86_20430 [Spiractinospora alimapuensis]|uniref:hypothetical protein n=1 Tax=Spiractinospora alimapuensis TaxID=2820884 RepID=UPI001F250C3F|nr:hypothetical protein [Spiractinospora alimapuensis]QVQ51170.1 hypothetical protein J4H86_20430 [Spiractinospora alimapuensis]
MNPTTGPTEPRAPELLNRAIRAQQLHSEPRHVRELVDRMWARPSGDWTSPSGKSSRQKALELAWTGARQFQAMAGGATTLKEVTKNLDEASTHFRAASLQRFRGPSFEGDAVLCDAWRGARMFLATGSTKGAALLARAQRSAAQECGRYQRITVDLWSLVANPDGIPLERRIETLAGCKQELDSEPGDDPERAAALRGWSQLVQGNVLLARLEHDSGRSTHPGLTRSAAAHADGAAAEYRSIGVRSAEAEALSLRAAVARVGGDEDGALTHLTAAIDTAPDSVASGHARIARARVLRSRGRAAESIRDLLEAVPVFELHEHADGAGRARRLLSDARAAFGTAR